MTSVQFFKAFEDKELGIDIQLLKDLDSSLVMHYSFTIVLLLEYFV